MDLFILLLLVILGIEAITYIILKILHKPTPKLNKVIFASYNLLIITTALPDSTIVEAIHTILVMEMLYLGVLFVLLVRTNQPKLQYWIQGTMGVVALYYIVYIIDKTPQIGIWNAMSEGIIMPMLFMYYMTILLLIKKHSQSKLLMKVTLGCFILFTLTFAVSFSLDILTIIVSTIMVLLIGVIFAVPLVLLMRFKKDKKAPDEDKGEAQNEKVKFF